MVASRVPAQLGSDAPITGRTVVAMPVDKLWDAFSDARGWPRWNRSFRWARVPGGRLEQGRMLVWLFNPIRPWLPYLLPAVARLVEVVPHHRVTWEVRLPGFHALHSYSFEDIGNGHSSFGSWETADGVLYRALRRFWRAHFEYVCTESLAGARRLARAPEGVRLIPYGRPSHRNVLVAVPGLDGSAGSVAPVVERLSASRRVLLVDYSAEKHPTLGGLADEIADTVASAVSAPVDVLGQSIGSILAADLACRPAVGVRRVVLVSTFTVLRWRTLAAASALIRRTPAGLYRRTAAPLMGLVCGPVGSGRDHPFLDAVRSSDPAAAAKRTQWEVGRDFSVELSALAATGRPTLVLMGAADRFVPDVGSETARLAELFGPVSVASVHGAGHVFLPDEAVAEAVERIEDFLG